MKFINLHLTAAPFFILFVSSAMAGDGAESPLTRKFQSLLSVGEPSPAPQKSAVPSHPVIIRVHEKVFASAAGDRVEEARPVNRVVLGTPAKGTCVTAGTIKVDAKSENNAAAFVVSFQGRARSRTSGVNGPARIFSHTDTDFVVTRTVSFSPQGFESHRTQVRQSTRLAIDDIQINQRGLRGAIVRRVAWKRARESQAAAEQEIARMVHNDLKTEFDRHLDEKVAELNRQFQITRYVNSILGGPERLSIQVRSSEECVQLAVGSMGAAGTPVEFPAGCPAAPIEVRVHESALRDRFGLLADSFALVANRALPTAAGFKVLGMLAWQPESSRAVGMRFENDWVLISFDPSGKPIDLAENQIARRTAN